MRIVALYGTESGNSEMVAEDIAGALRDVEVRVEDMSDFDPADLDPRDLYLVVCSSHGDGDLPAGARPFFDSLEQSQRDLTGFRYAMFGLGDRAYVDTYSQGSEHLDRLFARLGAIRIGEYGRHDASGFEDPSEVGIAWAQAIIAEHVTATV